VIYTFGNGHDGQAPDGGLLEDPQGRLFGTTSGGGRNDLGTVFELTPSGSGYRETILHSFRGYPDDGNEPLAALIEDAAGDLYGTTAIGGDGRCSDSGIRFGCGAVFELRPVGSGYVESTVLRLRGQSQGETLYGGLTLFGDTLFGTTAGGGTTQNGVVFSLHD
jgi:uncharacterized repeat protein (TIGR03803 family)